MVAIQHLLTTRDRRNTSSRQELVRRVRAEFEQMQGLRLTGAQTQRLFGLKPDVCQRVLSGLVRDGTLTRGSDDRHRLSEGGGWPTLETLLRHVASFQGMAS